MKASRARCVFVTLAVVTAVALPAGERRPVADFTRSPEIANASLSPDGQYMGYIYIHRGWPQLSFLNLATGKAIKGARESGHSLTTSGFTWVSNQRVLANTADGGLASVDRDGNGYQDFVGFQRREIGAEVGRVIYASGTDPQRVLLETVHREKWRLVPYPDVVVVNALTGAGREEMKNPGKVRGWAADWNGEVRFGLIFEDLKSTLVYREAGGQPWSELSDLGTHAAKIDLAGLDATGRILYVTRPDEQGRWTLYPFDLQERRMGGPLLQREHYDILSPEFTPTYAGVPLAGTIFSPKQHALIGVNYLTDGPHQQWFGPVMTALQEKVDALHPGLVNFIVSMDHEENRLLVFSWSDREPGFYSLLDLAAQKMSPIGRRMPWIKPEQMAPMFPIQCAARDGLELHGYLTLPPGLGRKNLPLVVLVHGGPFVRDSWGFDPTVQFLANRGYAVLQVNYRGSTGYGQAFFEKGKKEIGGAIQDDITDAVHWAVNKGVADPGRIAIMGASYGGYSTLFALAKTPELYRCGVDVAGVSDWLDLLERRDNDDMDYQLANAYWTDQIGDLKDDQERQRLAKASPVNFAAEIKAPLLIVHGKDDKTVPFAQAKAMVAALEKAGHPPKTLFLSNRGHSWPQEDDGIVFLNQLEAFLAQNLGAK